MPEFNFEIVKDPRIFQENRLPAHSDHEWYSDRKYTETGRSDFKYSLNGSYRFHYAPNPDSVIRGFEADGYNDKGWDFITVPGHIQMQGYGTPQYVNTEYPWDGSEAIRPGEIPMEWNPVGQYVKTFTLPDAMKEGPVYISFQGVESGFAFWINGEYVGYSEDSFTPSEFDLTPYIRRDGENRLAIDVFRFTSGSWCEDQDFFRFSGIFREVYLYTVPEVHIRDMKLAAELDDEYRNGILDLHLDSSEKKGSAVVRLLHDGEAVAEKKVNLPFGNATFTVENVAKWSAEEPNLYDLDIEVRDDQGNTTEYISEKVGFRRFEMKDGVMCLNGKRIIFNGVDRHEFSAYKGRAIGDEEILTDLITMKQNNINAIRTSHYPNQTSLYRMADELGLYVIDETNLETHGVWDKIARGGADISFAVPGNRHEYHDMVIDRCNSMLCRDRNHACILIWSLGNESLNGENFVAMHDYLRQEDPTRLVHYEGVVHDERYPDATDMVSVMYWPVSKIEEYLEEHQDKPFISCEYSHAMGNSCGGIAGYTELAKRNRLYQGGFIWDYVDQAIATKDRYGRTFLGYGGDFGDRPNDGSFSGNGLCYADTREPSPKMQEVKKVYSPIDISFTDTHTVVKNNSLFTNVGKYGCSLTIEQEGVLIDRIDGSIEVAPGNEARIPLPEDIPQTGETVITVSFYLKNDELWADRGHEIVSAQKVVGKRPVISHDTGKMHVVHGWLNTGVKGNDFTILFSNLFGGMISYKKAGKELIKKKPRPNFWRPLTENDIGNHLAFRAGQWKTASTYLNTGDGDKVNDYTVEETDDTVTVTYTYLLPTTPEKEVRLSYEVHSDGAVKCHLSMDASAEIGELPEFGVMFEMDADFDNLRWYGNGPEETYADRQVGGQLAIWQNHVADNMAAYLRPQECGNHTAVRWAEVTDVSGHGLRFEGDALSLSALPWSPDVIDTADHPNELPKPLSTFVRVDLAQEGIGGDDSWGARPLPQYYIDNSKPLDFSFWFMGI